MAHHLEYEDALRLLLSRVPAPGGGLPVPLPEALGRVAAADLFAPMDQPPFPRSPLDGYAFLSADTAGASPEAPAVLAVDGTRLAGDGNGDAVAPGHACRVMTGARLPEGTDCVVRQEDVTAEGTRVCVPRAYRAHENYVFPGEDVPKGRRLLSPGERITPAHIGVLAAQGLDRVSVYRTPVVGVLSTGSELTAPGTPLAPGKIYDSNGYLLAASLTELGVCPRRLPAEPDRPELLQKSVSRLLNECDAVITTGGVSVGQADFMPSVAETLCGDVLFHGVNVKPGGPLLATLVGGKPLLSLSGNPHAVMVTFALFGAPLVRRLSGLPDSVGDWEEAALAVDYRQASKTAPSRRFVRAELRCGQVRIPDSNRSPGALFGSIGCNCLVDMPATGETLPAGQTVRVLPLGNRSW